MAYLDRLQEMRLRSERTFFHNTGDPFLQRKSWYDVSSPRMLSQYGDI